MLTEAYTNREALEEKIAQGKRNRKEAGNKYGTYILSDLISFLLTRFKASSFVIGRDTISDLSPYICGILLH
jgi:hypothetical protein